MARVRSRVQTRNRHRKVLAQTKGHRGRRHSTFKVANESLMHALKYQTEHRRDRKGDFRRLWIMRINAAARQYGLPYGQFMSGLKKAGVEINRKMLADLAVRDSIAFGRLAEQAKAALA